MTFLFIGSREKLHRCEVVALDNQNKTVQQPGG